MDIEIIIKYENKETEKKELLVQKSIKNRYCEQKILQKQIIKANTVVKNSVKLLQEMIEDLILNLQ